MFMKRVNANLMPSVTREHELSNPKSYSLYQPLELLLLVGAAVIRGPCVANGKLVKLEHVHHTNFNDRATK